MIDFSNPEKYKMIFHSRQSQSVYMRVAEKENRYGGIPQSWKSLRQR